MAKRTHVLKLERMAAVSVDGRPYSHAIRPGRRYGVWYRFEPHEVPPHDGPWAMFECEKVGGHWKVLRRVAP
jgi:hypothetical protein